MAPNNSSLVAKRTVFSHGKYEKSGTIHIMGYNRNQELINLLTIVREPSEIKSVEKWWHGKWIDDRWLDGCDYDEIPLFPKIIVSWNPIISGFNLVKGMQDGKDIFGNKMENRHYIIATIDVISSMFGIPGGELMKMVDDVATPIVLIIDTANATYDQYSAKDKDSNESSDSNQDTGEGGFWENTNSEETITD